MSQRAFTLQRLDLGVEQLVVHGDLTDLGFQSGDLVDGNGPKRFSVQRKMVVVGRLLRGEPLELVARETNVSIARLTEWRERALAGAATALKERERDDRDDEIARLKSKVGDEALEGKRPLAHRRSRR